MALDTDRVSTIWIVAGAAAALAVAVADVPEGIDSWQPATTVAAVVAVGALIARSYRRPAGAIGALVALGLVALGAELGDAAGEIPFGHVLLVGLLLADVARRSSRRSGLAVAGLAAVVAIMIETLADGRGWADVVLVLAVWGLAGAAGLAVRFWRQVGVAQSERIRIAERERIARELHDVVAHHVSAIAMTASGARSVVEVDPGQADRSLLAIHRAATTTLDEMRRMVALLRNEEDVPSEVPQRLDDLKGFFSHVGTPVKVSVDGVATEPSAAVRAAVFRIAQEAVTNARRHAPTAAAIDVVVAGGRDALTVSVSNDGRVVPPRGGDTGYGLRGMRERAELLGGTFEAGPVAGGGWRVTASLPIGSPS